jgi:hypothetical protein
VRPAADYGGRTGSAHALIGEEFRSPVGEQIDPPTSENSEATPVEILTSSLLTPSSENTQPEVERDWTRPHKRLSLPRSLSSTSRLHASTTLADLFKKASHLEPQQRLGVLRPAADYGGGGRPPRVL